MARASAVNSAEIRLPKLCTHTGRNLSYCRINGKFHYFGAAGRPETQAKYRQFCADLLTGGIPLHREVDHRTTVGELLDAYEKTQDRRGGVQAYVSIACRHLRDLYEHEHAQDIGPKRLKTLMQVMASDDSYCRSTVNKVSGAIKGIFQWGVSEELVDAAVWQALTSVSGLRSGDAKREPHKVFPVSDSDIKKTIKHLPPTLVAIVQLLKFTGARPSEILTLTPGMVDKTGDVWTADLEHHKTEHAGKRRTLCFGPRAQKVLRPHLLRPAGQYCFSPMSALKERNAKKQHRHQPNREPMTERTVGDCYDKDSLRRAIATACDKAGIDRWTPYQLRHTAATAARRVAGLDGAQVMMGHSGMNVTQRYAEVNQDKAKQIARKIG
jgi:integrase